MKYFAVFYNLITGVSTKQVFPDISNSDSYDNIMRGLEQHKMPGEGMVIIPLHQKDKTDQILSGLGIKGNC